MRFLGTTFWMAVCCLILDIAFCSDVNLQEQQKQYKLNALVVFTRHGARVPANEDFNQEDWPGMQRGDLTDKGIKQLKDLGQLLRNQYNEFLPNKWDAGFVKVKFALNLQRTLLSMLSLLDGMFPDLYGNKETLSHDDLAFPQKELGFSIKHEDYDKRDLIFRAMSRSNCQLTDVLLQKHENEAKFEVITNNFMDHELIASIKRKLLTYRRSVDELEFTGMYHLKEIYDSFLCNRNGGKRIPAWNPEELKLLQSQYEMFFFRYYCHRKARLLSASAFFQEVFNFIEDIRNNRTSARFYLFSGTKTNIAILISSILSKQQIIDLKEDKIAPLSAAFLIEIYEGTSSLSSEWYATIKYAGKELKLEGCALKTRCTYKEFKILLKTKIVRNLPHTCDIMKKRRTGH